MTNYQELYSEQSYQHLTNDLPKDFKPKYNKDGSIDYPVIWTSINPDKEEDTIDIPSFIIPETCFVGYNHYTCGGTKVQTGAEVLRDTIIKTELAVYSYVRVHPTDEMFFCEINSRQKKTNGKLIDAIKKNHITGTSIGYRFNKADVKIIQYGKKSGRIYYNVIAQEISLLDIAPMNYNSRIINKSIQSMKSKPINEKNKCLQCLIDIGVGAVGVNPENIFVKVTEITDTEVKGIDFDGNEVILDDSYEPVSYEEAKDEQEQDNLDPKEDLNNKSCGCQNPSNQTKVLSTPMTDPMKTENKAVVEYANLADFQALKAEVETLKKQMLDDVKQEMNKSIANITPSVTQEEINQLVTDQVNASIAIRFENQNPLNNNKIKFVNQHPYL